jgi:hypothetical protein
VTALDSEMAASAPTPTRVEVGSVARARLVDADYADAFSVVSSAGRSAEEWARRALESGAQAARRAFGLLVWHGLLGFRLAQPSTPGTVAGWSIIENEPGILVLHADGSLMTGRMVFQIVDSRVTWTTLLRYERSRARYVWAVAGHAHRAIVGPLLRRVDRSFR